MSLGEMGGKQEAIYCQYDYPFDAENVLKILSANQRIMVI